jgi:hypothetical protein
MGLAMQGVYHGEMHEASSFYDAPHGFDVVVFTTLGWCLPAVYCQLEQAINGSRPARLFFVAHHADDLAEALPLRQREAARGMHVLTLAPHVNVHVNQAAEAGGYGDLPDAQWLAPIFPIVLPEECDGGNSALGKARFGENVLDDANSAAPSAAVNRVACNRSALWQTVAMPPPEQQRLSFCLQVRNSPAALFLSTARRIMSLTTLCLTGISLALCVTLQGNLESNRCNYSGLFGDIAARAAEFSAAGVSLNQSIITVYSPHKDSNFCDIHRTCLSRARAA